MITSLKKRSLLFAAILFCGVGLSACDDDASEGSACDKCSDTQFCHQKQCIDKSRQCGNKVCKEDQVCTEGECKEKGSGEGGGETTPVDNDSNQNVNTDPCKEVTCPEEGQACLNGRCYDSACIEGDKLKTCGENEKCVKGECQKDDECAAVECDPENEVCVSGVCEDKLCYNDGTPISCMEGTTCQKGTCVDNQCLNKTCTVEGQVCSKGECVFPKCLAREEACATGKVCNIDGECAFAEETKFTMDALESKETDENGNAVLLNLHLNNPPSKDVTLNCELSPDGVDKEASVDCSNIVITAENYAQAHQVSVVGLADNTIDEDFSYKITITTVCEDEGFNGLKVEADLVNKNVDVAGVRVNADELVTSESGDEAIFSVVLKSQPTKDVTFTVTSKEPTMGLVKFSNKAAGGEVITDEGEGGEDGDEPAQQETDPTETLTVTFTSENWNKAKSIAIVGQDTDDVKNTEERTYKIEFGKTSSEDSIYNDLSLDALTVTHLDNDKAEVRISPSPVITNEDGNEVEVTVTLGLAPTKPVNLTAYLIDTDKEKTDVVSKEAELVGAQDGELTLDVLNADNHKTGVTFKIKGIADHNIDNDKDYLIGMMISTTDPEYKALGTDVYFEATNQNTDTTDIIVAYDDATVTEALSEANHAIKMQVTLQSRPPEEITVTIESSNEDEVYAKPKSLKFSPNDDDENAWNKPQEVTVTGEDDEVDDGDQVSTLSFKITGGPREWVDSTTEVSVTTIDNDDAEILLVAEGAELMENNKDTIDIQVKLGARPEKNVTILLESSDYSELGFAGLGNTENAQIIIKPEDWNKWQTVTLQVHDDNDTDATQYAYVKLTSSSQDEKFDGLTAQTPIYSILDNESANVTLTLASTTLWPNSSTLTAAVNTTLSVALSRAPEKDMTVTLKTSDSTHAKLEKTSLTFTKANWNTKQTVKVTNTNPQTAARATTSATISATASNSSFKTNTVTLTLKAFPSSMYIGYTGTLKELTLLPGKYQFSLYGSSGTATHSGCGTPGYGGTASGYYSPTSKTTIYMAVGGNVYHADTNRGGYNGGGLGHYRAKVGATSGSGGGATHVAISKQGKGTLESYSGKRSDVLLVAGGGGGIEWCGKGGNGGGTVGSAGSSVAGTIGTNKYSAGGSGTGGTQTSGGSVGWTYPPSGKWSVGYGSPGSFGYGGYGYFNMKDGTNDGGAGGGGGWYGGGGTAYAGAAGGGSGYINTSKITSGSMGTRSYSGTGYIYIYLRD